MSTGWRRLRPWFVLIAVVPVLAAMIAFGPAPGAKATGTTIFVNRAAGGADNGTTWTDAFTSLQSALAVAVAGDLIYVAGGTYLPSVPAGRSATFAIPEGVKLYGSFKGTESSLAQRVLPTTPTSILTGNVGARHNGDNSYHVVTPGDFVTIDGFVIRDGNANAASPPNDRGANLVTGSDFGNFRNLLITRGNATWDGGGAYVYGFKNGFHDVVFTDNVSARNGGGLALLDSDAVIRRSTFLRNEGDDGGAMWLSGSGENLTFAGNTGNRGGAVATYEGASLTNVTIYDTTTLFGGGHGPFYSSTAGTLAVGNAILWGNTGAGAVGVESGAEITITGAIVDGTCPASIACTDVSNVDPMLEAAAGYHGGFVPTLRIAADSPAIDAAPLAGCLDEDARKAARPFDVGGDGGDPCDFGAYEYIPPPVLSIDLEPGTPEGDAVHEFFMKPSHAYPETITFEVAFSDGTAKNGLDYSGAGESVTLDPLDTLEVRGFTVTDDALDEANESFTIALPNPTNAALGPSSSAIVTITDDDAPPSVVFLAPSSPGLESLSKAKVAVKLSAVSGQAVNIGYQVTGGSATNGTDYKLATAAITIPAGQTSGHLILTVLNDWAPEPDETVVLKLAQATNVAIGAANTHTYTIENDDKVRFCQGKKVTIYGTPGKDKLAGTTTVDIIDGLGGDDTIRGAGGNDVLCGSGGKDVLRGGPGNDALNGGNGADKLFGAGGNDTLLGKGGADTLRGELGRDRLSGGSGKPDVCDGGPSTDVLLAAHGCESVAGVP